MANKLDVNNSVMQINKVIEKKVFDILAVLVIRGGSVLKTTRTVDNKGALYTQYSLF